MALLECETLRKSFFGVEVLHGVSFSLDRGRVLGLVGENGSGKSTTMNILGGVLKRDGGRIRVDGADYEPRGPRDALACGISFIHQELNLFENLSIEENLFISGFPRIGRAIPFISRGRMRRRARELLEQVDIRHPPGTPVGALSQGERQLVEIAKALSVDAKVIIFDEPTTSLTRREADRLFGIIERLRGRGIAMIYISHVLSDVTRICDDITVLRDGAVVGGGPASGMPTERMIALMVGRTLDQLFPERTGRPTDRPVLEVRGVTQPGVVHGIDLTLHAGEVLGIAGLMGAGRSELARILFGLDGFKSGTIAVDGAVIGEPSPGACMERGMAFLTEDRRGEGLMMHATIADNIALPSLEDYVSPWTRFIDRTRLGDEVGRIGQKVRMRAADPMGTLVRHLSGGNQQKVVLAKWLLRTPRVFILDEPTRGIDVGAKFEIYKIIDTLVAEGAGVLMISSEMEELMGMCDRILVMNHGEIQAEFRRGGFDGGRILEAAMRRRGPAEPVGLEGAA
ncbi:sugar ABC transporter ATP-binding protein [Skermanella rosea]|uniref:sugar ABC transporter ATP-binding protein n=1 Tax=Skermanella rosea TaxID=1817965 RepID=UPI001932E642|nr:sugar ABC transporter ATP-binding protein [Skermanella rosea]UEM02528.1 sugar ABC transporter ATP-binding protein [Skermanella rosea]